jgi:uncharacterized membrane protein YhaH (DUF805 family)
MNQYFLVLKKYSVFKGRAQRMEFWFFYLFHMIVLALFWIAIGNLGPVLENSGTVTDLLSWLSVAYVLATFLPALGVLVRRLHDVDRSGWWALLAFAPITDLVILIFAIQDGTPGANRYGPDPKPMAGLAPAPADGV